MSKNKPTFLLPPGMPSAVAENQLARMLRAVAVDMSFTPKSNFCCCCFVAAGFG